MALRFFKVVDDPFYVVRSRTVGEIVARAIGVMWSPAVGQVVKRVLSDMGCSLVLHNGVYLVKRMVPTNLTEDEAWELSADLRGRKRRRKVA